MKLIDALSWRGAMFTQRAVASRPTQRCDTIMCDNQPL